MNYQKIYDDLIRSRSIRVLEKGVQYEQHHIIPKCLGGSNDSSNLILLTPREHFLAHWLLWRIHRIYKLAYAFKLMSARLPNVSSRAYAEAKEAHSNTPLPPRPQKVREKIRQAMLGRKFSEETLSRMSESHKGNQHSEESKLKMSSSHLGKQKSDEHRLNIRKANLGKTLSEDHKKKISDSRKGYKCSEETKQKMRESHKRRQK